MAGLTSPAGSDPAVRTCTRSPARWRRIAAAICERPAFCTQTKSTSGMPSAGSEPADEVSPAILSALDEIGVPIGGEFPKPLTDEVVRAADVVVTMGCGDACPVYPGKRYLDWELDDPVGLPVGRVRDIRDDIDRRVRALIAEMT